MFFFNIFADFRWIDIIDVIILTLILYRLIIMVQGTRTSQIVIGLSLVGLAYYLSRAFDLRALSWIFTSLINSLVVIIIVIFQSDFRNALAQVGKTSIFREKDRFQSESALDIVIKTCNHFSRNKIGALIVFENEVGLKNYTSSGTKLDANISSLLLISIFNKLAPLHDGAAIINKHGKIQFAGCILPLTTRLDLSSRTGTRHRAAIGLSEETDAVILTVSEETGKTSMVYRGEIQEMDSNYLLKEKLDRILTHV